MFSPSYAILRGGSTYEEKSSTKLKIDPEITKKHKKSQVNMSLVKCTCGEKILVVPDVAAMDRAIKNHIAEHKNADEQFLIQEILKQPANKSFPKF